MSTGAMCRSCLCWAQESSEGNSDISAEFRGQRRKPSPQEEVIEESRAGWAHQELTVGCRWLETTYRAVELLILT